MKTFMSDTLKTRHPCHEKRHVVLPRGSDTKVVKRACPACGSRWQAVIRPAQQIKQGEINVVEWVPI